MNRYHIEQKIVEAFIDFCRLQDKPKLPELWQITLQVDWRAAARMETQKIQAWFCGFLPASKLGMWWSYQNNRGYDTGWITLHGTRGEKPVVDRLVDLIMWLQSFETEMVEPGKVTGNLTLLTKATEPYSY